MPVAFQARALTRSWRAAVAHLVGGTQCDKQVYPSVHWDEAILSCSRSKAVPSVFLPPWVVDAVASVVGEVSDNWQPPTHATQFISQM